VTTMLEASKGLTEKLYWRRSRGQWHCFKRLDQGRGYISLCDRREINFVQGQKIARPEVHLRCGVCDGLERSGAVGHFPVRFRPGEAGAAGAPRRRFSRAR
jgi:hypothetical protein